MPGEEKGSYIVSRACADGLEVLLGNRLGFNGQVAL